MHKKIVFKTHATDVKEAYYKSRIFVFNLPQECTRHLSQDPAVPFWR